MAEANPLFDALLGRKSDSSSDSSSGSSGGGSSGSGGTTSNAPKEDVPTENNTANFMPNAFMARELGQETAVAQEREPEKELSQTEAQQRRAEEMAARLGLSAVETENLKLSALGAGGASEQAMQQSLRNITGIDPAILAMAAAAGDGARKAGATNPEHVVHDTGHQFGKQVVGTPQQQQETAVER